MNIEKYDINGKIIAVARLFPGAVVTRHSDEKDANGFTLGPEEKLWISHNRYQSPGRISISGCWPRSRIAGDNSQFTPRECNGHLEAPGITVDANKSPEQIKRDIERRFLPDYRAVLAKCIERRDTHDAYINGCNATAQTIAQACGQRPQADGYDRNSPRQSVVDLPGDFSGRFECSNGDASLTVRSLSVERAVELAKLLARWASEDRKGVAA